MPIYEYRCDSCDHELEAIQKISDEPLRDCPACGKPELKKLISAPGFRLKGSGWYETDFKNKNKKNLAGDQSQSKSDSKEKGAKSESASKGSGSENTPSKPSENKESGKKT